MEELHGPRWRLVPLQEHHISSRYIGWLNDSEVNQFLEVRLSPQTEQTVRSYVRSFHGDERKYAWAICDGTEMIGTTTLINVSRYHGSADVGIMIGEKSYWGKGVAKEVIGLVATFVFRHLRLRRLTAGTYAVNYAMNAVFENLGFAREGVFREALILASGETVDLYRWGLLAREWEARQPGA